MKILWLTNIPINTIAKDIELKEKNAEGWLTGLSRALTEVDNIELNLCFAQNKNNNIISGSVDKIKYKAYPQFYDKTVYSSELKDKFKDIIEEIKPDIIHIMGTEYPHCYSMMQACQELSVQDRTVISIQGLVSVIAQHYGLGVPAYVMQGMTLRDLIKHDSEEIMRKEFVSRGVYEIRALQMCKNVIGRTEWDYACTKQINEEIKYYFNNETLRPAFYEAQWDICNCTKQSIFVSQVNYPVKGFHFLLKALPHIIARYPDTHVYVAGSSTLKQKINTPRWRRKKYENYLFDIMEKNKLFSHITFLGSLDEYAMRDQYLKSNVLVSASTIENSPNSVGEAMILGVPIVTSDVGGIKSLLVHDKEGYLYQGDAPYMLAHYVSKVFNDREKTIEISKAARQHALRTHNAKENVETLLNIYEDIVLHTQDKIE